MDFFTPRLVDRAQKSWDIRDKSRSHGEKIGFWFRGIPQDPHGVRIADIDEAPLSQKAGIEFAPFGRKDLA
jgi:hypothetical protein